MGVFKVVSRVWLSFRYFFLLFSWDFVLWVEEVLDYFYVSDYFFLWFIRVVWFRILGFWGGVVVWIFVGRGRVLFFVVLKERFGNYGL